MFIIRLSCYWGEAATGMLCSKGHSLDVFGVRKAPNCWALGRPGKRDHIPEPPPLPNDRYALEENSYIEKIRNTEPIMNLEDRKWRAQHWPFGLFLMVVVITSLTFVSR